MQPHDQFFPYILIHKEIKFTQWELNVILYKYVKISFNMTPKQIKGFVREWEVGKQILNTCTQWKNHVLHWKKNLITIVKISSKCALTKRIIINDAAECIRCGM